MSITIGRPCFFCLCVRLAEHSVIDKNSRLFAQLTNVFLAFLALTDFHFEFRCFQWGSHPAIVTVDECIKLQVNQMTPRLAAASRPETTLDFDMSMVLNKLSLISPVFFGERVQFVMGELEAVGRTPAWVSPANRFYERGVKTSRAVVETTFTFKDGQRAKLMDALNAIGEGGISQVDAMSMGALKQMHIQVFDGASGSRCFWGSDAWLFPHGRIPAAVELMITAESKAGTMWGWMLKAMLFTTPRGTFRR